MIIGFVIICFKFIGFLFLINSSIGLIFTLIEAFFFRNVQLNKSKFYAPIGLIFIILTIVSHVLIYSYLARIFSSLYSTVILTRWQLLLMLIPLFIGISLLNSIAKHSERNFEIDYSRGKIINFIQTFLNVAMLTLLALQVVLLFVPSVIKNLISFYGYILG